MKDDENGISVEMMTSTDVAMETAGPEDLGQQREASETALLVKAIMGEWQTLIDRKC